MTRAVHRISITPRRGAHPLVLLVLVAGTLASGMIALHSTIEFAFMAQLRTSQDVCSSLACFVLQIPKTTAIFPGLPNSFFIACALMICTAAAAVLITRRTRSTIALASVAAGYLICTLAAVVVMTQASAQWLLAGGEAFAILAAVAAAIAGAQIQHQQAA